MICALPCMYVYIYIYMDLTQPVATLFPLVFLKYVSIYHPSKKHLSFDFKLAIAPYAGMLNWQLIPSLLRSLQLARISNRTPQQLELNFACRA